MAIDLEIEINRCSRVLQSVERILVTSACLTRGLTLALDGSVQVKRPTPVVTSYSGLTDLASGYEGD
eukprot:COSAG06_NODE_7054_length_2655_cov_2.046557_3_plen_66_part_01